MWVSRERERAEREGERERERERQTERGRGRDRQREGAGRVGELEDQHQMFGPIRVGFAFGERAWMLVYAF